MSSRAFLTPSPKKLVLRRIRSVSSGPGVISPDIVLYDRVIVERAPFTCVYSQLAKQRSLPSGIPEDCGE